VRQWAGGRSSRCAAYRRALCPSSRLRSVRYGGSEVHTIAALVGGVAAQEVVKVVTHQFEIADNTYLYNGISSASATMSL